MGDSFGNGIKGGDSSCLSLGRTLSDKRAKQTYRKAPLTDPHVTELMARGRVHQVEEAEKLEASRAKEPMADQEEEVLEVDHA
uniref:Uncharacterized protein n=1 Tax=Cannabis sativa TaxID=3483 RepID=A0A803PHY0_CANSA